MTNLTCHKTVVLTIFTLSGMILACRTVSDPLPPNPSPAPAVSNIRLDDPDNAQNATDFEVRFDVPDSETGIREYRVLVVKAAVVLDAASAGAVPNGRYTVAQPTGASVRMRLTLSAQDTDGDAIQPAQAYHVYVLTVADGVNAQGDGLAVSVRPLTLAVTTLKITHLGNDGVLIEDNQHKVLIDALHRTTTGWVLLDPQELSRVEQGGSPYDGIGAAMVTHNHGDHFHPGSVTSFLSSNPTAQLLAPPQVRTGLTSGSQITGIAPAFGARIDTVINGIPISILHLRHFNQFGNNFSAVENYGYLVTLGGKRLLHLGDVEYSQANLAGFGLDTMNVDVVFLPTFNTLLSQTNADLVDSAIAPNHVVALHFQTSLKNAEATSARQFWGLDITTFTTALDFIRR